MDWLLLDDKINKVMRKVAQLNGDEYHESFYNLEVLGSSPRWPTLKIKELRKIVAPFSFLGDLQVTFWGITGTGSSSQKSEPRYCPYDPVITINPRNRLHSDFGDNY